MKRHIMITGDYALKERKEALLKFKRYTLTHKHIRSENLTSQLYGPVRLLKQDTGISAEREHEQAGGTHGFRDRACAILGQPFPVTRPHAAEPKMRVSVKGRRQNL